MKAKVIFIYEFEKRNASQVVQMNRKLFGYVDQSNHGKYIYKRKGLLSDLDIERISKGVLMIDIVNDKKVLETLHGVGTKRIKRYYVQLDKVIG